MSERGSVIRTEVRGLDLCLDGTALSLSRSGEYLTAPIALSPAEAERLAMEMVKAQLWEWNQIDELKRKADKRHKNYLGSWLVMCLAAFSAYVGFPGYYLPVFLLLISILLWWRASFVERKDEQAACEAGAQFIPDWSYIRQRLEESSTTMTDNGNPPSAVE
ncbi:MAG: hypothetical protein ACHP8B_05325 [Terriglobales bacterium]